MEKFKPYLFKHFILALTLCFSYGISLAQGTLSGSVKDIDGETLIGATIIVNGTTTGTSTDIDGNYRLEIPSGDLTITYSYTGFSPYEMTITVEDGSSYTQDIILNRDNLSLDEVVVTGTFSGRTQKSSPMSMTKIGAAKLQQLSSNSQADILRTIPGITAEGGGGEVATNLFVRGFPSGGQYAFTPLNIDGIPVLSTFGLNSSAHDVYFRNDIGLQSLEFVRGGSATLQGAGSVAGIVNYQSIRGSDDPINKVQLEWAEGGRIKTDFLAAGPISKGLYYAFSGFYRYDEGPLETGLPTRGYQLRGNVKKVFNDGNSSLVISAQKIDDNVQFYLPYPLDNSNDAKERPTGNDGETIYTMLSSQLKDFSFDTPFGRFKSPIGDGVTTNGQFLMAELKHSFGNNWRLSAKTKAASYDHWFNLFLDGDGTHNTPEPQDSYLQDRGLASGTFTYADNGATLAGSDLLFENRVLDRQRDMEELVGEVNLTKTIGIHNLTVGTFMSNTKALDNNWIHNVLGDFSNSPRAVSLSAVDTLGNDVTFSSSGYVEGTGRQTNNRTLQSTKIAAYIADEIKGDKFGLDIGLRWEKAIGNVSLENGVGSNNFNKGIVDAADVAFVIAGLYELNDKLNIYANGSRGYFFPQLRSLQFAGGTPQSYETETVIQGEIGAKYGDSKLSGTAAIFFNALSDRRNVDIINDGQGGITEFIELQSTRTVGIEANLNYNISKGFNAYGNFTYQDHEFTEVEGNKEQEGKSIARIPNVMGMVGLSFDNGEWDANLSSNFLGSKFANNSNTVELDGFNIMRLDAGYTMALGEGDESLRLGLSVFNLLDADGVTEGSPRQGNTQVSGGNFFVGRPILPRRIFIRATFNF
jgi:outer membrane receptor protein involved in Fe transport